jgi:hypothetical protein
VVAASGDIEAFEPRDTATWDSAVGRFTDLVQRSGSVSPG